MLWTFLSRTNFFYVYEEYDRCYIIGSSSAWGGGISTIRGLYLLMWKVWDIPATQTSAVWQLCCFQESNHISATYTLICWFWGITSKNQCFVYDLQTHAFHCKSLMGRVWQPASVLSAPYDHTSSPVHIRGFCSCVTNHTRSGHAVRVTSASHRFWEPYKLLYSSYTFPYCLAACLVAWSRLRILCALSGCCFLSLRFIACKRCYISCWRILLRLLWSILKLKYLSTWNVSFWLVYLKQNWECEEVML